jgi:hypothetical protein
MTASAPPTELSTASPLPSQVPSALPTDTPTPQPSPRVFISDDGLLAIDVPGGALPDDVSLTATALGGTDLPPELAGLEVRSAFYAVTPPGLEFASPATFTRRVGYRDLGLDPESDGLPVLALAMRSIDGRWAWLDAQQLTTDEDTVTVGGHGGQTGTLFAFGATTFVGTDWSQPNLEVPLGSSATLTVSLGYPGDTADPPVMGALDVSVGAADVVALGSTTFGPDGASRGQEFRCVGPGTAAVSATFTVSTFGAGSILFEHLGLGPVSTEVTLASELTCSVSATPSLPGEPSTNPAPT